MTSPKMMIVMRRDLKMRKGKIAVQAGHACVEAVLCALIREGRQEDLRLHEGYACLMPRGEETPLTRWMAEGMAKVCVYVDSLEELLAVEKKAREVGLHAALIQDAGRTEFHGEPTFTCLAIEPAFPEEVDPVTGELPLY